MFRILILMCSLWLAGATAPVAAESDQVLRAQQRLTAAGFSPGPTDGVMGAQTRNAIEDFQRRNALPVTGELDWQTQMALSASVRSMPGSAPPPPLAAPVPDVVVSELAAPNAEAPDSTTAPAATAGEAERAVSADPAPARSIVSPATGHWVTGSGPYWLGAAGLVGWLLALWGWRRSRRAAKAGVGINRRRDIARSEGAAHFAAQPAVHRPVTPTGRPG